MKEKHLFKIIASDVIIQNIIKDIDGSGNQIEVVSKGETEPDELELNIDDIANFANFITICTRITAFAYFLWKHNSGGGDVRDMKIQDPNTGELIKLVVSRYHTVDDIEKMLSNKIDK